MAGTLTISTLSDGTNSTSATNCIQGSAKAWVNFNGTNAVINGSFNVSSITNNGSGLFTLNFTNAMVNANYASAGMARNNDNNADTVVVQMQQTSTKTTSAFQVRATENSGGSTVLPELNVVVFN